MGLRILLIDDHVALRRGVQGILADRLQDAEFGHAGDGPQAFDELRKARWDIAVLDLNLPGRGGLDLIRGLKDEQPTLGIVVYSMHAEDQFGLRAIRAGADGYVMKEQPPEELTNAILAVRHGRQYLSPSLAMSAAISPAGSGREGHHQLSDREFQVLRMLASGKSPSEIGEELSLSGKTVSTYRARVLEKLNLRTNADLVRYAIEKGIAG